MHINILIKYKRKWPGRVQQTGTTGLIKENPGLVWFHTHLHLLHHSVQIQHSLCIKVTLNNSGSISIIQCLLLYGLTLYKCSCVWLLGPCLVYLTGDKCGSVPWVKKLRHTWWKYWLKQSNCFDMNAQFKCSDVKQSTNSMINFSKVGTKTFWTRNSMWCCHIHTLAIKKEPQWVT